MKRFLSSILFITNLSQVMLNLAKIQSQKISGFGLEDGGCPIGTVPISRGIVVSGVNQIPPHPPPKEHCVRYLGLLYYYCKFRVSVWINKDTYNAPMGYGCQKLSRSTGPPAFN